MKFLVACLSLLGLAAAGSTGRKVPSAASRVNLQDVKTNSKLGKRIMNKARKLEGEEEVDFTWVADFSIKFQGCHHITQWNEEADGEEDVRLQTKRLVRFRLCESSACSAESASGCSGNYGDYIIDMNEFLEMYYESVEEANQRMCENLVAEGAVCECDGENQGDDFDEEICQYDCFKSQGVEDICADKNPYAEEGEEEEKFELREYVECAQVDLAQDDNNRRKRRRAEEEEEIQYFIGPYCSEQGGSIYLGLFTDETCTAYADKSIYYQAMGKSLPYSSESVITMDCFSCKEAQDADENNNGDNQDADEVIEMCENLYSRAGKCEKNLNSASDQNNNACNYMAGIKVARRDGIITQVGSKANKTASVFIGIFVVAFVLLAAYVYYLKTKLDRASINLSE